jgi:exopolysaccharide biosynthesis protein
VKLNFQQAKFLKPLILRNKVSLLFVVTVFVILTVLGGYVLNLTKENSVIIAKLKTTQEKLNSLQSQDQYKENEKLKKIIKDIETSYKKAINLYERITDLKAQKQDTKELDKDLAKALDYLSELNYSSASANLNLLTKDIEKKEKILITPAPQIAQVKLETATPNNNAPSGGFSSQVVSTDNGKFNVSIVAADLNSTKVVVDTASDSDCSNNCPTMALGDYVARSGAFAGINGSYFCPAEYPSCAGKTGSFDLLVMNKNKVYFNSANNVYSNNPAVIFSGSSARFVGRALEWGRDTGVDSVLSNYPLLVSGGNVSYSGGGDAKYAPKGARTFIANKGSTVFIGIVFNASMQDSANVLKALGMDNALNLDQGGSTALWYGGYKAGPGRGIPNAILFVRK